jgi:hypothetical protein
VCRNVVNAAINVLAAGRAESLNACGAQVRPASVPAPREEAGIRPDAACSTRSVEGIFVLKGGEIVNCTQPGPDEPGYATVRVAPRPGALDRVAGAVPTPHGLVRVEVKDGQVRVDSPVPARFVSLSGETSSAAAGHREFTL